MTVRLRAHHLLCLPTYVGKGYSAAFVANCEAIVARLNQGEELLIVDGPDDMCAPLLDAADAHCYNESTRERDRQAARDVARLLNRPVTTGTRLTMDSATLGRIRLAFAAGSIRSACLECPWHELCTAVSAGGFGDARLGATAT